LVARREAMRAHIAAERCASTLVAVVGHTRKTEALVTTYQAEALSSGRLLPGFDLVIISTINRDHGAIAARSASSKHVVAEYPLCWMWLRQRNHCTSTSAKQTFARRAY